MVGWLNKRATLISAPSFWRTMANMRTVRIEVPPRSKKLSWMPTRATPSRVFQMSARIFFGFSLRGNIFAMDRKFVEFWRGKFGSVDLAVAVKLKVLHADKNGWNHVVGQLTSEEVLEVFAELV